MPDNRNKHEANASGKYYITNDCDGCGKCFPYALQNIMYTQGASKFFIYRQPIDDQEKEKVQRALKACPISCIKDDGAKV